MIKSLMDRAQKLRDDAKKKLKAIQDELFNRKPESFLRDMKEMRPLIETLVELVQVLFRSISIS